VLADRPPASDPWEAAARLFEPAAARFAGPLDVLLAVMPGAVETPALRLISDELVARYEASLTEDNPQFLAVSMGPQEGKSTLISFAYPLWLLMQNPDLRIMLISYEQHQAVTWGEMVRDAILANSGQDGGLDLGLRLRPTSAAKDRWFLAGHRGGMVCMGIEGPITGKPGDVVLGDDLVKDRKQAMSAAFKKTWRLKWGTAVRPRLGPRAYAVLAHTRWGEDDPIGQQLAEHGDRWRYVNIPAQAGERDPLGRAPGEWLVSARGRTPEQWEQARRDVGEHDFAALWQGEPMPAAGGLFKRAHLRYWTATNDPWTVRLPGGREENVRYGWRFATVDLAASTRSSADWTVAAVWSITPTGELLLLDLARARVDPEEHWDLVRGLVERWQAKLFVEASQFGTDLVYTAGREGAALEKLEADTDKYTRAVPAARRIRQGTVFFPAAAAWLPDLVDELLLFPGGAHDDQVDVVAYASRVMSEVWWPGLLAPPADLQTPRARRAEVGQAGTDAFDPMGVQF